MKKFGLLFRLSPSHNKAFAAGRKKRAPAEKQRYTHEMKRFYVNIEKPKSGWIRFKFKAEGGEINFCASYTPNDVFENLVCAVLALYENGDSQRIEINAEPRVYELILSKPEDLLVLEILNNNGATEGKVIANFHTGCREFARKCKFLLEDIGYNGFVSEWRHKPPKEQIKRLWENFV